MFKNTAGQTWVVFAFDLTDNTPLAGDAANITANLRIDGVQNAIDDVNPTELERGFYAFDLTQAETNGDNIAIAADSTTADIQVIGVPGAVYTREAMRGTDGANTVVPPTEAQMNARTLVAASYFDPAVDTVATVTTVSGDVNGDVIGSIQGSVQGDVDGNLAGDVQGQVVGSVGSVVGHTNQTADHTAAIAAIPTATEIWELAAQIDGMTPTEAMQIMAAAVAGKLSGAGTGTEVFLGLDGLTTRITATIDGSFNRTAVVTVPP